MANAYKYQFSPEEAVDKLYQKGLVGNNNGFLQTLIDDSIVINANSFFWQEHFAVRGGEEPIDLTDLKKNPAWTVAQKTNRVVPMADPMAPLAETAQLDNEGWSSKTGSLYQYGKGLYENSMSKLELQARLRELSPEDANLINGYVRGVADLVKTHNYRLSHMAAQVLSMGGAYNSTGTQGFSGVSTPQSAYIPTANFVNAGEKVWGQTDCDIPTQMQKIEYDFRENHNVPDDVTFEWDIPYDMLVNTMMKNQYFIKEVNNYIRLYAPDKVIIINNGASSVDTNVITWEQLVEYSKSSVSKISPIRVVKESQTTQNFTTTSTVSGWKDGVAVLRPMGYAGVVVHAKPVEIALLNSGEVNKTMEISTANVQNFLYLINKVVPNGMLKAYHTDMIGRYAPVLSESMYHVVVNTKEADA